LKTKTSPQTSTEGTAAVGDNFFSFFYTYRTLSLPGTAIGLCCSGSKILKILLGSSSHRLLDHFFKISFPAKWLENKNFSTD
jgi:hypothetical protein